MTPEQQNKATQLLKKIGRRGYPEWDEPHNGRPHFYDGHIQLNTGFVSEIRALLRELGINPDEDKNEDED